MGVRPRAREAGGRAYRALVALGTLEAEQGEDEGKDGTLPLGSGAPEDEGVAAEGVDAAE